MRDPTSPYTQRRYRQVPLYLQEILAGASRWTNEPDNYNALVNAALELDDSLFLTLNYDTLLDGRFAAYTPADRMDWYIDTDRGGHSSNFMAPSTGRFHFHSTPMCSTHLPSNGRTH